MRRLAQLLAVLLCLALIPLGAAAQAGTQTVDLGDGYSIAVPAAWDVTRDDPGAYTLGDDAVTLTALTETRFAELSIHFPPSFTVEDVLVSLTVPFAGVKITRDDAKAATYDDRAAAVFTAVDAGHEVLLVALALSDQTYGFLAFSGASADLDAVSVEIDAMIASFDSERTVDAPAGEATVQPLIATSGGAVLAGGGASGAACTVSAAAANTGQLRVGPGTNRSAIAFLPAAVEVTVTGRIVLDDGSVWFQLDKAEAAPQGTAAAELWVNAEDVTATGSCDQVGEANAPPVIPISVAPPPSPADAPADAAAPAEAAQAGSLPAAGAWTTVLNATTNASCLGYDNVPYATAEVYTPTTFSDALRIVDGGSFYVGPDLFRRIGSSNSFAGTFTFNLEGGGQTVTQVRFDLISATRMTGQIVDNYKADDGTPCSDTVTFVSTRG